MLLSSLNSPDVNLHPTHGLVHTFCSSVRHVENLWKYTHSAFNLFSFKSLRNQYHKLILAAKKDYYSNLVPSSSENAKRLWETINKLLNRKSSSSLPSSTPSLADSFASFISNKISKLRIYLSFQQTRLHHLLTYTFSCHHTSRFVLFHSCFWIRYPQDSVKLLQQQSDSDPTSTWLLKECASVLIPTITNIVNLSLITRHFHATLKEFVVPPLLNKPTLDRDQFSNYRPISNLSIISKITTESVVKSHLIDHLTSNNLLSPHLSAYGKHHSTVSALLYIHDLSHKCHWIIKSLTS